MLVPSNARPNSSSVTLNPQLSLLCRDPGGTRTHNRSGRNGVLCPIELRGHCYQSWSRTNIPRVRALVSCQLDDPAMCGSRVSRTPNGFGPLVALSRRTPSPSGISFQFGVAHESRTRVSGSTIRYSGPVELVPPCTSRRLQDSNPHGELTPSPLSRRLTAPLGASVEHQHVNELPKKSEARCYPGLATTTRPRSGQRRSAQPAGAGL